MKAVEFFKDNGLSKCSRIVEDLIEQGIESEFVKDLKRLVESNEFVSANGGVEEAMKYINNHDPNATSKHYNALRTKVSDVESCL